MKIMFSVSTLLLCGTLLFQCSQEPEQPSEQILVSIDDSTTISVNEFIRRAEYVPRPDYCKGNHYLHKKIILNSLIAEKLLALQVEPDDAIFQDEEFVNFLKGRKEQAMRQWMHHVEATQQVQLDSANIAHVYNRAGREYEIAYFSADDSILQHIDVEKLATNDQYFDNLYQTLTRGDTTLPTRTIKYKDPEQNQVHQALYENNVDPDQTLPPIKIGTNRVLFIKVLGWSDNMAMTETQREQRFVDVQEKMTQIKASAIWNQRVGDIMHGKQLDFNEPTFYKTAEIFYNRYFKTLEEKRQDAIEELWKNAEPGLQKALDDLNDKSFMARPLFSVDGDTWTVSDFRNALSSHPLVFRNRKMSSNEFAREFRLAVVDLIRDHFVTREAYRNGYDKVNLVQRSAAMWRDTFLALYEKRRVLDRLGETRHFAGNYHKILDETLNPYVDSLQQKYNKKIQLDFETFEDIALTSIDVYLTQPDMPYQNIVPLFPVITSDHMIEYIARLEE